MKNNHSEPGVSTNQNITSISNLSSGICATRFCTRCDRFRPVGFFKPRRSSCNTCERTWQTHKIKMDKLYYFFEIVRDIGGSYQTLERWRNSGRLIVISNNKSMCRGQRLIEAIENRLNK